MQFKAIRGDWRRYKAMEGRRIAGVALFVEFNAIWGNTMQLKEIECNLGQFTAAYAPVWGD